VVNGVVLTLDDLRALDVAALRRVMDAGHPLEPDVLAGRQYLGVDLSLPGWARRILWLTFRKTFVRDEADGGVRGWNVRMEQHGVDGPRVPLRARDGRPRTFGHYRLRSAAGTRFPRGWSGTHVLDYTTAGNLWGDFARLAYTPLVAVNEGSQDLLLGWEVLRLGGRLVPLPLYWALRHDGPVEDVVPPPRPVREPPRLPRAASA